MNNRLFLIILYSTTIMALLLHPPEPQATTTQHLSPALTLQAKKPQVSFITKIRRTWYVRKILHPNPIIQHAAFLKLNTFDKEHKEIWRLCSQFFTSKTRRSKEAIAEQLITFGPKITIITPWLVQQIHDSGNGTYFRHILTSCGQHCAPILTSLLKTANRDMFFTLASILGETGDRSVIPWLTQQTKHKDMLKRHDAIEAIGLIGDLREKKLLRKALLDKDSYVIDAAVEALGAIQDNQAWEYILPFLEQKDNALTQKTLETLKKIGNPAVVSLLKRIMPSQKIGLKIEILKTIKVLQKNTETNDLSFYLALLKDKNAMIRENAEEILLMYKPEALIPALYTILKNPLPQEISSSIRLFEQLHATYTFGTILSYIDNQPTNIRIQAYKALASLNGNASIGILLNALSSEQNNVLQTIEKLLQEVCTKESLPLLYTLLNEGTKEQKLSVLKLLVPLADLSSFNYVEQFTKSNNTQERLLAIQIIGNLQHPRTFSSLSETLLDKDPKIRLASVNALIKKAHPDTAKILTERLSQETNIKTRERIFEAFSLLTQI